MVEVRHLDYFVAVVEQGSLRAAAEKLGVTQPALTKAVRRLEDSFGVPLFDRQARGMTLTAYGTALLRHARDLQTSAQAAWDELAALRSGVAGLVKIGAGPSWQDSILAGAISELRALRSGVRVQVFGGSDDQLKAMLQHGAVDFILAAVPDTPRLRPDLVWRSLLADEYCIIADRGHPLRVRSDIKLEDLLAYPWILPSAKSNMVERLRIILRAQGLPPPEPAVETDVISLKFALMRDSDYLSINAAAHLNAINPGFLAPLDVPGTRSRRDAGIITRRSIMPSPATNALIKILETLGTKPIPEGHGTQCSNGSNRWS